MKIGQWLLLGLLVLGFVSAEAKPVFQITTTTPSVSVSPGQSVGIVYQITNVSGITMPQMKYYPPLMTTIANSSTCIDGQTLANNATCELDLTLTLPSTIPIGTVFTLGNVGACGFNGKICSINNPANRVTVTVIPVPTPPLSLLIGVAAGDDLLGPLPLIAVSTNGTFSDWATKSIGNPPDTGELFSASCAGRGDNTICAAAGIDSTAGTAMLVVSTDAGATWANTPIVGNPAAGSFASVGCTGSGATAICVAAGQDNTGLNPAMIAVSMDGGTTWTNTPITGNPDNGQFFGADCTGSNATAVCVAVGRDLVTNAPLIVVSMDGGTTWTTRSAAGATNNGAYEGVSCTGSGSTAICVAVGHDDNASQAMLAVSTDGGNTWTDTAIADNPANGFFKAASCTGSGSTAICMAAGQDLVGTVGMVAVSTDGGSTWTNKTITGNFPLGNYTGASCVGSGSTALCVAVGTSADVIITLPIIAVSTDGGNTWVDKSFTGENIGQLTSVTCTGDSGPTALCAAVGQDASTNKAMIVVSTDGGNTWATTPITGNPDAGGFNGAGSSSVGFKNFKNKKR